MNKVYNGKPKRTSASARAVVDALCAARTKAVTPRRSGPAFAMSSMRRALKSVGMEPKSDPGAGLPSSQANMARLLARGAR